MSTAINQLIDQKKEQVTKYKIATLKDELINFIAYADTAGIPELNHLRSSCMATLNDLERLNTYKESK